MPDQDYAALAADLVALGRRTIVAEPSPGLAVAVMSRIDVLPVPAPASLPRRVARRTAAALGSRRRVLAAAVAVLLALLVTPPVRAAVADWFGFAGVIVRIEPGPDRGTAPPPPTAEPGMSLDEARGLVGFEPLVPTELGPPDGVEVSADRRVLSMSWTTGDNGTVRLDQFDGRLDYAFAKSAAGVEYTTVGGGREFALWFDQPHEVVVLDADGTRRTETARLAGNTLIWDRGLTALRLEGDLSLVRAREIASSVTAAD